MRRYWIEVWDTGFPDWPRATRVWMQDEEDGEYYEVDPSDGVRDAIYRLLDDL